jgi:VRR-NUC domain
MTEAKAIAPSEAAFTATVLELARVLGWRVVHFRPARTARGWRTPVQGDGAGFPDVVLVKPPRVIFAELKSDTGTVSPQQRAWLDALGRCPGVEAHVWRPRDLREIEASLRARPDQTSPKCSESKPVTRETRRRRIYTPLDRDDLGVIRCGLVASAPARSRRTGT